MEGDHRNYKQVLSRSRQGDVFLQLMRTQGWPWDLLGGQQGAVVVLDPGRRHGHGFKSGYDPNRLDEIWSGWSGFLFPARTRLPGAYRRFHIQVVTPQAWPPTRV